MFQMKAKKAGKLTQSNPTSKLPQTNQTNQTNQSEKTNKASQTNQGNRAPSNEENAESKKSSSSADKTRYSSERVIGSGSFGVVYKAVSSITREAVAIKKVKEDPRYKNRELQIMKTVSHPNVVTLKDCFYSRVNREIYLNLVMEYIPETLYVTIRNHAKAGQTIPFILTKLYSYQICRALAYCHQQGVCHRDIKPQNLLLDPDTHTVKLCDFGSAKNLKPGEPNVAYICSRYYRAPELIFESSSYHTSIDVWSVGCVISELFLTTPLFQGERSVDQLVEIIKVLGTPTRREIAAMNPNYTYSNFPTVKPLPWSAVFEGITYDNQAVPNDAIDLLSKLLIFTPSERLTAFDALAHPYFDELRSPDLEIPGCKKGPNLFNFTQEEIEVASKRKILHTILPKQYWEQFGIQSNKDATGGSAGSSANTNANGDAKPTAKGSTSATSSVHAEQQYVLSRVQEIAEERQLAQPTKGLPQKN